MTPAARLGAAIELLTAIDAARAPADEVATDYFRGRRYAGSKDRAAITALVYGALRSPFSLDESLTGRDLAPSPRTRVLALASPELRAALGDGPYSPAPLSDAERRAFELPAPPVTPAARAELPPWLYDAFVFTFGALADVEAAALLPEAPVDLRVIGGPSVRGSAVQALAQLGLTARPTPWSPVGLRLDSRAPLGALRRDGTVEVQDEGSQLAARLVGVRPGERVLDRCAGAGGKTLALADDSNGRANILASDVSASRLDGLIARASRCGLRGIEARVAPPGCAAQLGIGFDRILVDAPCSGTGVLRRTPGARTRLDPAAVSALAHTQGAILDEVAPLVGPGGRLIYVTCSVLDSENAAVVTAFLGRRADYSAVPVRDVWAEVGLGAAPEAAFRGPWLQLTPRASGTDGFFVAVLQRM